ncbi:hypothetical protein XELAEV_18017296mg [Xenopus laevis]|uniref:Uncharacterized protein n=1 Tax=Xenopus laevis TaxID=8355 RepID=A0A974HSW1_XENLA|nr:hypothetical protein XELAEV_18017296mg [Xenopus laevis]
MPCSFLYRSANQLASATLFQEMTQSAGCSTTQEQERETEKTKLHCATICRYVASYGRFDYNDVWRKPIRRNASAEVKRTCAVDWEGRHGHFYIPS